MVLPHRDIRFATSDDGVSLAFWEIGEGEPIVLIQNWGLSHAELEWTVPSIRRFYESMAARYRLIRFDPRGVGLSGDPPGGWGTESATGVQAEMTAQHQCRDLGVVVDAMGLDSFALLAVSVFGPVGIEYAATHPSRVGRLILWDAMASVREGHLARTLEVQRAIELIEAEGERSPTHVSPWHLFVPEAERSLLAELIEFNARRSFPMPGHPMFEWDSTGLLGAVAAPTLIVCSQNHIATKPTVLEDGRRLATAIPNAQLRLLDGVYSPYFTADQAAALDAIDGFLQPEARPNRLSGFRTVVFTDIVDSTRYVREMGDEAGRNAIRAVEERVAALAGRHGGRVIKHLGDGSLVSFVSSTAALWFALDVQAEAEPSSLPLRVGMAAGEPIEEGDDIHGAVVAYASRLADLGGPGDVIASDTMRQLAMGKGFGFTSMGQFDLKGFDEPATAWKVSSKGAP